MKKILALIITLTLMLSGCVSNFTPIENPPPKEEQSKPEPSQGSNDESSRPWYEDDSDASDEASAEISDETSDVSDETSDESSEEEFNPADEPILPKLEITQNSYQPLNYDYVKAVWLTQFDLLGVYRTNGAQRDRQSFTEMMKTVFDNIKKDGYNTVFLQMRPNADSYYPSEYYPISHYVSGAYGKEDIYDPIEIAVSLAHERGLSIHAWLNPMRAMTVDRMKSVPNEYYIKQWYNDSTKLGRFIVEINGQLYLNPAHEQVRNLIACGAAEVCAKYNVDGVHIDDYFYPTTDSSFDKTSYDEYKSLGGTKTLTDFRYENIDLMVSLMYSSIKSVNKNLLFGVSPEGNIDNTYNYSYTDVYKWCSTDGYLDYICPQIYFGLEHQTHDLKKVYGIWSSIVTNPKIRVFVGMTFEKADLGVDKWAGTGKNEWSEHKDILKRCLEFLGTQEKCSGISMFSYQFMYDAVTGVPDAETRTERDNMKPALDALA